MEISEYTIYKLVNHDIINSINTDTLQEILKLIPNEGNVDLKDIVNKSNCSSAVINEAYINILSLITESVKYDCSTEKLSNVLNNIQIQKSHIKILCGAYDSLKSCIRRSLQVIGNSLPHVIDIHWRLSYIIKTNTTQPEGILYYISLTTKQDNKLDTIKFVCNLQQLQELVYKLKDVYNHLEKLSIC